MKIKTTLMTTFRNTLTLCYVLLFTSCFATNRGFELVGSTPGDETIKSMLSIPPNTKVDFIKWILILDAGNGFDLNIIYGESQPNTLGFKNNGQKQSIKGKYLVSKNQHNRFQETYELSSEQWTASISLVKLNENIFHILTPEKHLMVGNGGWSYSLNRKIPVEKGQTCISSPDSSDKSLQLVFEGRTPCQEFAIEHPEMKASQACFKLKWKLTLNRDSTTFLPTTCLIRNVVDNQPRDVSGKWSIKKGTKANPDLIIYEIFVDNLAEPISLLMGNEDVLFFLDKNYNLLTGNENFGFVLNKRAL